jgi:hypothetical protein
MKNLRIENVGDINSEYNYLEIFLGDTTSPFLEISISENRQLVFKFYTSNTDILLDVGEWEYILSSAKDFLPKALKNQDDFLNFKGNK